MAPPESVYQTLDSRPVAVPRPCLLPVVQFADAPGAPGATPAAKAAGAITHATSIVSTAMTRPSACDGRSSSVAMDPLLHIEVCVGATHVSPCKGVAAKVAV